MSIKMVLRRTVAVGVMVSFLCVTSACYGPFNLTRNVYNWNSGIKGSGEVNDKWMKELVFFGMIIIPVYMFSALLDAFIFNSIQFWSGDNPIKVTQDQDGRIREVQVGETTIMVTTAADGHSVDVMYVTNGALKGTAKIIETAGGYALIDQSGRTMSEANLNGRGGITWLGSECEVTGSLTGQQVKTATAWLADRS